MATITINGIAWDGSPNRTIPILYHHHELQAYECMGCMEMIEIPRSVAYDPERLLTMREMLELDHAKCASYGSVREAQFARRYRKERDRMKLVKGERK